MDNNKYEEYLNTYVCCICLNKIQIKNEIDECYYNNNNTNIILLNNCRHVYHKKCFESYIEHYKNCNKFCPLCKNDDITQDLFFKNWITNNLINLNYYFKYLDNWKNKKCINNNHFIIFIKQYGIIAICLTCKTIQSFNYINNTI